MIPPLYSASEMSKKIYITLKATKEEEVYGKVPCSSLGFKTLCYYVIASVLIFIYTETWHTKKRKKLLETLISLSLCFKKKNCYLENLNCSK